MTKSIVLTCATYILSVVISMTATAATLPKPTGKVILTVSGEIAHTNTDKNTAEFDRDMLLSLGVFDMETVTPWTEGSDLYQGPMLSSILQAVGAMGETLKVSALNDYSAKMPLSDATDYDVMLAMDMNGEAMSIRDKGPLFIIYPFSDMPELNNEVIHNRSVWQIKSILVE